MGCVIEWRAGELDWKKTGGTHQPGCCWLQQSNNHIPFFLLCHSVMCCWDLSLFRIAIVMVHMSDLSGCLNVTVYLMAYRILVEYCLSDHSVVFQANGPQLITKGWSKNLSRSWRRGHLHTESKSYFRRRKVATRSCPSVRMTLVELSEWISSRAGLVHLPSS